MVPENISEISDVGYLLILLRMASENGQDDIKTAVLSGLHHMGFMDEESSDTARRKGTSEC